MNNDRNVIETTFNMVKEAMSIVGFSINYRGIPTVVYNDSAKTSCYFLNTHTVVLKNGYESLAHELCHSMQTYETLAHHQDKGWYYRACEQQAMSIEKIEKIGLEKIRLLIAVIGNEWTSDEMFSWVSYFYAVLSNRILSKNAPKPFHLAVSKRKALNALTDKLNFGEQ